MSWWSERPERLTREWWVLALLSLAFLTLYLPGLGDYGLFDPWETHYGEVARDMLERGDHIDPYWGSPWDSEGVKRERGGFYSKPPLTMWMMSAGMALFGHTALGVRFFFPLLGLLALLSVYLTTAKIVSRRAGLLAVALCGLAPSFGVLTHQAVTDGPLVSLMTLGAMALALALADARDGEGVSRPLMWLVGLSVTLVTFAQLWVIWPMDRSPDALRVIEGLSWWRQLSLWARDLWWVAKGKGWVIALTLMPLALWVSRESFKLASRRLAYLTLFYVSCGLMVAAKGWLGWAPLGGALMVYLIVTQEWRWLKVARPGWGLLVVLLTGHIWVLAMLGGHHPEWFNRFIKHDHINRLFLGVHSTDDGGVAYFVQWLGYGLFPSIALLPYALMRVMRRLSGAEQAEAQNKAQLQEGAGEEPRWGNPALRYELLLFGWALVGFFLFSRSSTKFHHYIFPLIPPCAILTALTLDAFWRSSLTLKRGLRVTLMSLAAMTLLWVGSDLVREPSAPGQSAQQWVNLFTYKYDRAWPTPVSAEERERLNREAAQEAWLTDVSLPLTEQARADYTPKLKRALRAERWHLTFSQPMKQAITLALLGLLLIALSWGASTQLGTLLLVGAALRTSAFLLHTYLPTIAPHWSQGELWDAYYSACTPFKAHEDPEKNRLAFEQHLLRVASRAPRDLSTAPRTWCAEPVIAFRMNWRGETFYTDNTVTPVLYSKDLKVFLKSWPGDFYIFTERKRIKKELRPALPPELKGRYQEVFGEGLHFALLKVTRPTSP